jgi:hypothetical protein
LQALTYTRKATGRISLINDPNRPAASFTYAYDTLGRLVQVNSPGHTDS